MPVTAKLSLLFYERFGEQIATELVDWFNSVDATYRADLRELNELNFSRFDAKLEQRVAQLLTTFEARFASIEARFDSLEGKLLGRLESRIAEVKTGLQRWMLASWSSLMLVLIGTLLAVWRSG
jgi:hypothetical protein